MSKPKMSTVVRQAVKNSGETIYSVAKGAGVTYANLMRFLSRDRELSQGELDALIAYLGIRLVIPVKPQAKNPVV
jgi:hypothetical protein